MSNFSILQGIQVFLLSDGNPIRWAGGPWGKRSREWLGALFYPSQWESCIKALVILLSPVLIDWTASSIV